MKIIIDGALPRPDTTVLATWGIKNGHMYLVDQHIEVKTAKDMTITVVNTRQNDSKPLNKCNGG